MPHLLRLLFGTNFSSISSSTFIFCWSLSVIIFCVVQCNRHVFQKKKNIPNQKTLFRSTTPWMKLQFSPTIFVIYSPREILHSSFIEVVVVTNYYHIKKDRCYLVLKLINIFLLFCFAGFRFNRDYQIVEKIFNQSWFLGIGYQQFVGRNEFLNFSICLDVPQIKIVRDNVDKVIQECIVAR